MRLLALILLFPTAALPAPGASPQEFAQTIYKGLARVTGDGRRPPPLDVVPDARRSADRRVAWFDGASIRIGIDERTVRLCQSLGSQAEGCVAFFLGHELAHFYKDHAWGADFGSRFSATPLGAGIRKPNAEQRLAFETQADDTGGVYGYLAGYDSLGAARDALRLVYKEYAIPDTGANYPSLLERQSIAKDSAHRLSQFVPVFEAGNLLFAIGRYRDAADCFDHIAKIFPSREILNNAGVALALASGVSEADWYPWLLDSQTRLRTMGRRRSVEALSETERRETLDLALRNLEDASRRDPEYVPAVVNLALVNDLLGRHGTAVDAATRALEMAVKCGSEQDAGVARLARAIANIHRGDPNTADKDLAAAGNDPPAAYWKAIAAGQSAPARIQYAAQKAGPVETVTGQPASAANPVAMSILVTERLRVLSKPAPRSLELHVITRGGHLRALITRDYDQPTARGVRRGAEIAAVKEAYGEPSRLHHTAAGGWYVYDRAGLVIRFSPAGTVEGWTVYAWQE